MTDRLHKWLKFVSNRNVLAVLFYLDRYGHTAPKTVRDDLKISRKVMKRIIDRLDEEGMIDVDNVGVMLSDRGRVATQVLSGIAEGR